MQKCNFIKDTQKMHDHLQLIKFWQSRTPGKGVCSGAKNVGSALLQPRPVSPFLQVVLVDGIPLSSVLSLWHFSRWHFNPWSWQFALLVYCCRV